MSYALRLAADIRAAFDKNERGALELALQRMVDVLQYSGQPRQRAPGAPSAPSGGLVGRVDFHNPPECARVLSPCRCATRQQRAVCMDRKPAAPRTASLEAIDHAKSVTTERLLAHDCAKGKDCTCTRTAQRETCLERTVPK